jgi:hypothetical protein
MSIHLAIKQPEVGMPQTLNLCRTSENEFMKEVIPMRKRTYRAVTVKQLDMEQLGVGHDRLILGCDAAKEIWYGPWIDLSHPARTY